MAFATLGRSINAALANLSSSTPIDEKSLDATLNTISSALLTSDVNVLLVKSLRDKVRAKVLPQLIAMSKNSGVFDPSAGGKGRNMIQTAVFDELVRLVDPGENAAPFKPTKGKVNVLMLVGLQGAGKTTTATKLAVHFQKRGLRTCLVCADTFRAGAFDQLKQNAAKARVPFFGSYTETDPVAIARAGVEKFRAEKFEVIIVDTSGRHRQESELFEEMVEIGKAVRPDMTVMVLDGAMGQAAEAQARAFKEAADFGAIIVTKLDGHAKGGGAISAVAATRTPIIFLGTGENFYDLETFSPSPFISKLLGMGDIQGLIDHQEAMRERQGPEQRDRMLKGLVSGVFTVRDLKEQLTNVASMGPLSKLTSMIPGMSSMIPQGVPGSSAEDQAKAMKRMMYIFDSMTSEELDSDGSLFVDTPLPPAPPSSSSTTITKPVKKDLKTRLREEKEAEEALKLSKEKAKAAILPLGQPREPNKRILRIARGSGTSVREVEELLSQHQAFKVMMKKMGGKTGMAKMQQAQARASLMGGAGGAAAGAGGMPDLSKLSPMQLRKAQEIMKSMTGGGGMGGMGGMMPDLTKMMGM